jgi:putative addiction module component (TIGR02574 family)
VTDLALRLKDELLRLSEQDRVELARILWESVDREFDQEMDEAAWIAELERRSSEAETGRASEEPFREVIDALRKEKP